MFNGADDIAKSNLRALSWLGVAAHGDTEPQFRMLFNKFMKEVPAEVKLIVREVVEAYRDAYTFGEHFNCSTNHPHNVGVVKRTFCQFKLEAMERACGPYECWANKVNVN